MRSRFIAAMLVAGLTPAAALAQEPTEDSAEKATKWTGDIGLGLLFKRGNTNSDSVNGYVNASRDSARWRHTFKADALNEEEQDQATEKYVRTDESYYGSYKLDRKLGEEASNYLFNVVTYKKDVFSGYQYEASYALGLGRRWVDTDTQTLDLELGPGYRLQCFEPEDSYHDCEDKEEDAIARLGLKYVWKISENTEFKEDFSTEAGESSTTTRAETSLTTAINSHFALRLRHLLEHESETPSGSSEADHQFSVGVVYTMK